MTRRRLRRVAHEEVGLQIAPMIDVTLLLLFFFMLSGKLTRSAKLMQINVPTAAASHDTPATSSPRDVINLDAAGEYFTGEQHVSIEELTSHLRTRFQNAPPLKLQVRADATTPAAKIKELMRLAAEAGALEVVYGVRPR